MKTMLILAAVMAASGGAFADTLDDVPVVCESAATVEGREPSLLPKGRTFKLVWNDEFDGNALDESKWGYRTTFWGKNAHWFAKPEDGAVEVKDGLCRRRRVSCRLCSRV